MTMLIRLIFNLLLTAINLVDLMLLIYVVMSWFMPQGSFYRVLHSVLEPLLTPIRIMVARMSRAQLPLDISPIILWVILRLVVSVLQVVQHILL